MKMPQIGYCLLFATLKTINTTVVLFLPLTILMELIEMIFLPMFARHNVKKYGNGKNLNYKY